MISPPIALAWSSVNVRVRRRFTSSRWPSAIIRRKSIVWGELPAKMLFTAGERNERKRLIVDSTHCSCSRGLLLWTLLKSARTSLGKVGAMRPYTFG